MIAGRLCPVSREVSINIPSETASFGAASPRGPRGSRAGAVEVRAGSRNVSSNPKEALVFERLSLPVSTDDTVSTLAESRFLAAFRFGAGELAATVTVLAAFSPAGGGGAF